MLFTNSTKNTRKNRVTNYYLSLVKILQYTKIQKKVQVSVNLFINFKAIPSS